MWEDEMEGKGKGNYAIIFSKNKSNSLKEYSDKKWQFKCSRVKFSPN